MFPWEGFYRSCFTRGARIAKDGGHIIRAKNIIEGGPDSYSLHFQISQGVDGTINNEILKGKHNNSLIVIDRSPVSWSCWLLYPVRA